MRFGMQSFEERLEAATDLDCSLVKMTARRLQYAPTPDFHERDLERSVRVLLLVLLGVVAEVAHARRFNR
jgi:hypothetical protein